VQPVALFERAPGYGIITFDRASRKITMANWPRWVDAAKPGAKPYGGWPITIHQFDNGMPQAFELEPVKAEIDNPVVQVIEQSSNEPVYTVRIQGRSFTPKVARAGAYTVRVFDPDRNYERVSKDVQARAVR
jgi:hypothetical protein